MATVYINSATGNDSNTYAQAQSSSTPWLTMAKAQTSATAGDTAILMPSASNYNIASYSSWSKSIIYQAATYGDATVSTAGGVTLSLGLEANFTFTNLRFTGFDQTSAYAFYQQSAGRTHTFTNCVFDNIKIANSGALYYGYVLSGLSVTFTNCKFRNIGCSSAPASNATGLIVLNGNNFSGASVTLTGCTVDVTPRSYAGGLYTFTAVSYNINMPFTIKNTVIYNEGSAIPFKTNPYGAGPAFAATYSNFYNLTSNPTGTGVITTDPLFVDAANDNYNLRPSSPALDSGTTS